MAYFNIHQGSWKIPFTNIGLPDFNLTEIAARLLGSGFTKEGGSDIIPNRPQPQKEPPPEKYDNQENRSTNQPSYQQSYQPRYQSSSQPSQLSGFYQPPEDRSAKIRGQIEGAYNDVISALDEISGLVPQRRAQEEAGLKNFLQTQTQALEGQKQTSLSNLDIARQQVEQEVGKSKEDIYSSLRNLLQSAQQKIGLAGAGQSSAFQTMLPYALGKQAGRSLGQVQSQAIKQFNEIDTKKNDVGNTYNLATNQLNQDYQNNMREIANRYNGYLDEIRMKKAGASQQKQLALAQLEQGIMEQARAEAQNLRNFMLQRQMMVEDWARNRMAQLDNYKVQLGQMGQFNPQDIVYSELQGMGGEMSPTLIGQGDWASILAMMQGRKKALEGLSNQS